MTKKFDELRFARCEMEAREKACVQWIEDAAQALERAAKELRSYAERAKDGTTRHCDALAWAVNHAMWTTPNLRMDLACSNTKMLQAARSHVERLEKAAAAE